MAEDKESICERNALMEGIMAIFDEVWTSGSYPGEENIPEPVHIRTTEEALGSRNNGPLFDPETEWKFEYQQLNAKSGKSEARYAAYGYRPFGQHWLSRKELQIKAARGY